jgi:predicted nucleic acid-binding protein
VTAVVDASFAACWLLPDEGTETADALLGAISDGRQHAVVPALWDYEMTNLLLVAHRRGRIDRDQIEEGQRLLQELPARRYDHTAELSQSRVGRFALRFGLSGYDASYLELVDRLQCVLYTQDRALREAAAALGLAAS